MSEMGIGHHTERPSTAPTREGAWLRNAHRAAFEKLIGLKRDLDARSRAFSEQGKRQLDLVEEGSALPAHETRRVMNQARAQEKRLEAEVETVAEAAEEKRKSVFRKWMEHPIFKMGVISAAIHGTLIAKGMSMPEEMKEEIPQTVLQPQSVAEMERIESRRAEREARVDREAVTAYKQSARERMERGGHVSLEELYLDLEGLNGVPESTITEAKRVVSDLTDQFMTTMGDGIDPEDLQRFVKVMYGSHENYDWGQASVAKYLVTKKRNCFAVAKAEAIVLERIIQRLSPEEQERYKIGIQKLNHHEIAALTIQDHEGYRRYLLEPLDDEGRIAVEDGSVDEPGTKTIPIDTLLKAVVAEKPVTQHATEGSFLKGPDLIVSTDQPLDDGIRIEGELRASSYVLGEAKRQGVEPVEIKEREWGTTELSLTTPEEDAAHARKLKYGEDVELRNVFVNSFQENAFLNRTEGYANAKGYDPDNWFNQEGVVTTKMVKKINEWSGEERVKYIYHGALHTFDDGAIKEIPMTKAETVAVLYLPEENTEKIETLLDAAEGPNKPLVELQIREYEMDLGQVHSHSGTVRAEIRKIVARKNLASIAFAFKRFSVYQMELDPQTIATKDAELNRLNSRTAYDLANGKIKDVYLSGRTIADGDLLVLEHGKARIHVDLEEYVNLLIAHPKLLGSDKIVPWVRTQNTQILAIPVANLSEPVIEELKRLHKESLQKPDGLPPEPFGGMDY